MGFEFGLKGFTFSSIAAICWVVSIALSFFNLAAVDWIFGLGVWVFAIMGLVTSKKELAADPTNSKAKNGKIIGIVVIILEVLTIIAMFVIAGFVFNALAA